MEKIDVGSSRNIFSTLWDSMLLYGGEVWGDNNLKSTWKEFENVQKIFLKKFIQVKKQTLYTLLLEMRSFPVEIMTMERVIKYMLKVPKSPLHRLE